MFEENNHLYSYRTDIDWKPMPAGTTLDEALRFALARFGNDVYQGPAWLTPPRDDDLDGDGPALLIPISPGHMLVIGVTALAEQIRAELAEGFVGWRLHRLPATHTPIDSLQSKVTRRMYNILIRAGFSSVEEVAAVPESSWPDLHHVGEKFVRALRRVLSEEPGQSADFDERREYLEKRLQATTFARNRTFIDGLAATQIPSAALDKICATLDAEPVPPADPVVQLLLETAGQPALLSLYNSTHQLADD